jgi:integrase
VAERRGRGDGGVRWSESRQRFIAEFTIGYKPNGKRIVKSGSGKTETAARNALKDILRDYEAGTTSAENYTVADAVKDWLTYGLSRRSPGTVAKVTRHAHNHVIPALGARRLASRTPAKNLSADDVDRWLADKAQTLSTNTLHQIRSILSRSIGRAQLRDKAKRNVVLLCDVPEGRSGRPSKSLTFDQAETLLAAAEADQSTIGTYIVVSLLSGVRTEEMRAVLWSHVDLDGNPDADPPVPPHIMVWRSVRVGGDTKTKKSRRTLALPLRCVVELTAHRHRQAEQRRTGHPRGGVWLDEGRVFASTNGSELSAGNVRRAFRRVATRAGLHAAAWTPRELRHSFVSLMSDGGVAIEKIAQLVGHAGGSTVTERVYRHQLRPVIQDSAEAIDRLFGGEPLTAATGS